MNLTDSRLSPSFYHGAIDDGFRVRVNGLGFSPALCAGHRSAVRAIRSLRRWLQDRSMELQLIDYRLPEASETTSVIRSRTLRGILFSLREVTDAQDKFCRQLRRSLKPLCQQAAAQEVGREVE